VLNPGVLAWAHHLREVSTFLSLTMFVVLVVVVTPGSHDVVNQMDSRYLAFFFRNCPLFFVMKEFSSCTLSTGIHALNGHQTIWGEEWGCC